MTASSRKSYPVATPFKTGEGDGQEARLRLWTRLLAAGTGVLVFALAVSLFLVGRELSHARQAVAQRASVSDTDSPGTARPEPPVPHEQRPAVEAEGPKKNPASPAVVAGGKPTDPAPTKAVEATPPHPVADGKAAKDKPTASPTPATPAALPTGSPPDEHFIEVLGGLTAAHLYQSYLNIGLLADAAEDDVYPAEEAKKQLDKVTAMMEAVDKQLATLGQASLKPEDREALEQTRESTALLRTEAKELRAYWDSGDKNQAAKFHKAREEAWAGIKDLLGIKDKEE